MNRPPLLLLTLALLGCATSEAPAVDDPFFTLPLAGRSSEAESRGPAPGPGEEDGYELRLRFIRGSEILISPSLTVNRGQRASVQVLNQMAYVSDFDVETTAGAFIADPVVSIVNDGIQMEIIARPGPTGRGISLSYGLRVSELARPIRDRTLMLHGGVGAAVTIQLPAIEESRIVGRTLVSPGVDAFLAEVPCGGGEPLVVTARIEPVMLPGNPEHLGEDMGLVPDDGPAAEPLLDAEDERLPAPRSSTTLQVSVVRVRAPVTTVHLDPLSAAAALRLLDPVTVRTLSLRSAPERRTRFSCLLSKSYVRDYDRKVDEGIEELWDPAIGSVEVGLNAVVEELDGTPVLRWELSSLVGMPTFSTAKERLPLVIELPDVRLHQGALPLLGAVNLTEIGQLEGGDRLALLVRRTE